MTLLIPVSVPFLMSCHLRSVPSYRHPAASPSLSHPLAACATMTALMACCGGGRSAALSRSSSGTASVSRPAAHRQCTSWPGRSGWSVPSAARAARGAGGGRPASAYRRRHCSTDSADGGWSWSAGGRGCKCVYRRRHCSTDLDDRSWSWSAGGRVHVRTDGGTAVQTRPTEAGSDL